MKSKRWVGVAPLAGALLAIGGVGTSVAATNLDFDYKVNQGPIDTTFTTLILEELTPGTTTFSLDTALSGGQGNPGIVELFFGCNNCGTVSFTSSPGVTVEPNGVQAGYDFDYHVTFDPQAVAGNTPLTWTATGSPDAFLESTSGAGPNAFAMIQLTGGAETVFGENITSGFYVATAPVPEPSTYALMVTGLGLVGFAIRGKRKQLGKRRLI